MQGSELGLMVGGGVGGTQMMRIVSPHEGADQEKRAEASTL